MKQFSLLALQCDKDNIYDALIRSQVFDIDRIADIDACTTQDVSNRLEALANKIDKAEQAISYVTEVVGRYNATTKLGKVELPKGSLSKPLQEVDFCDFLDFGKNADKVERQIEGCYEFKQQIEDLTGQKSRLDSQLVTAVAYESLPHPTTWYHDTISSVVRLCCLPSVELSGLLQLTQEYQTVTVEQVSTVGQNAVVVVVAHKSESDFFDRALANGLNKSSFVCEILPKCFCNDLRDKIKAIENKIKQITKQIVSLSQNVLVWQVYVDYLALCQNKITVDGTLQNTDSTFVIQGYFPAEEQSTVDKVIQSFGSCCVYYQKDIAEDEFAPTLTKNNKLVKPFESITNNYTPPSYHEVDPTPTMSLFYFILFGFMVADIGYGLLLLLVGLFATFGIKQNTGTKALLQVFGFCGLSAVVVGLLYGGFFSYQIYPNGGVIPDPAKEPMVTMFISLLLGIVHISAGIVCNMEVKYKHNQKLSAWLVDFPWIIVFASFVIAIWNAMLGMANYQPYIDKLTLPNAVQTVGLVVCLVSLAFAIIFAGFGSKGLLGKMAKSFGSAYGIINYFSDIMSYIRVFGLMLSSALMGSVINDLGTMVIGNGGIGYVLCAVVLVFAHLFNLVMGLLSVYIHNGRLQYVEFFGKFYTGDGRLFVPFGSQTKYVTFKQNKESKKGEI